MKGPHDRFWFDLTDGQVKVRASFTRAEIEESKVDPGPLQARILSVLVEERKRLGLPLN